MADIVPKRSVANRLPEASRAYRSAPLAGARREPFGKQSQSRRRKAPVRGYRDDGRWRAALRERFPVGIAIFYSGIHESARPIVTGPTAATDVISGSRRVARCVIHVRSCTLKHIPNVWSIEPNAKHHPRAASQSAPPAPPPPSPSRPPAPVVTTTFPTTFLFANASNASHARSSGNACDTDTSSRASDAKRAKSRKLRASVSGSRVACAPQYTPCTVTFFTSAR